MNEKAIRKGFTTVYKIFTAYVIINILFLSSMIATILSPTTSLLHIIYDRSIYAYLFFAYILFKVQNFHIIFYAIYSACHIVKCIREKKIILVILGLIIIILGIALNVYCIVKEPVWTARISW